MRCLFVLFSPIVVQEEIDSVFSDVFNLQIGYPHVARARKVSGCKNVVLYSRFGARATGIKPCRNYTMTAYATPVFAETNTADNTLSSPTSAKVKLLGDINGDGKIDAKDVAAACVAYGSYPGHPRWNLGADINSDGKIDVRDIAVICRSFGQSCI